MIFLKNQPAFYADLTVDYYLFLKLKEVLKRCRFTSNETVIHALLTWFTDQENAFFQRA
jgi:hypothetical protein